MSIVRTRISSELEPYSIPNFLKRVDSPEVS